MGHGCVGVHKHFEQAEVDSLAEHLCRERAGFMHVNLMRGRDRWGPGPEKSEKLIVRLNVMERNNCATTRASLDRCEPGLCELVEQMVPHMDWITIFLMCVIVIQPTSGLSLK